MAKEKIVILNSGGIDSRAVAKMYSLDDNVELHSLFISFPRIPSNDKLQAASKETADKFCVSHTVTTVDGDLVGVYFDNEAKQYVRADTLTEEEAIRFEEARLMPSAFLRGLIVSIGMSYARTINANKLITGHNEPDINKWCDSYWKLAQSATPFKNRTEGNRVVLKAPLEGITPIQVADMLTPEEYASSVSCTKIEPCGHCHACERRASYEKYKAAHM